MPEPNFAAKFDVHWYRLSNAQLGVCGDETAYTGTIARRSVELPPSRARGVAAYGCSASRSIAPNAVEIDPDYARIFLRRYAFVYVRLSIC